MIISENLNFERGSYYWLVKLSDTFELSEFANIEIITKVVLQYHKFDQVLNMMHDHYNYSLYFHDNNQIIVVPIFNAGLKTGHQKSKYFAIVKNELEAKQLFLRIYYHNIHHNKMMHIEYDNYFNKLKKKEPEIML